MTTRNVLEHSVDHLAIRSLIDRYTDAVNRRDWATLETLFASDGVWDCGGANMPAMTPGNYTLPQSANGLRLSFFVYRGPGDTVKFEPRQTEVWEHTRDGGNSPWSSGWQNPPIPADNKWTATATFTVPGTYVVRALAHDGGLFTYEDMTVTVTR